MRRYDYWLTVRSSDGRAFKHILGTWSLHVPLVVFIDNVILGAITNKIIFGINMFMLSDSALEFFFLQFISLDEFHLCIRSQMPFS